MAQLILHHFDISPFAEKARLAIGIKGLAWHSVQIPLILPKPDLMPLTGGYRKTPVLQIGADIYCDTKMIAIELERRFREPTLFPSGRGMAMALTSWSDRAFFEPGAGLAMGVNAGGVPEAVLNDRKAFFNFMNFDRLADDLPHLYTQLLAHADLVEEQLVDGRSFLFGDQPGFEDINAYFPLWMARNNIGSIRELFSPLGRMAAWEGRMAAIGHGQRTELDPQSALDLARAATPAPGRGLDRRDPLGLSAGQRVVVTPDDYGKVPVEGELVTLETHEVAVLRHDSRVGDVVVHFPRIGYRITAVA